MDVLSAPLRGLAARPALAAVAGALTAVPLFLTNLVVVHRIEPYFSWLRPGPHTSPWEFPVLFGLLALMLAGAVVALASAWAAPRATRRLPVANAVVATLLTAAALLIGSALGAEIYACDVAGIPNCD
jgi:hypothetical protein